jgi:hypothetical protein
MKRILLACILIASGCSPPQAASPPPPEPEPPPPIAEPAPPPVHPATKQIASITHEYHAAAAKELPKALAPDVPADYVSRIHDADIRAREALSAIEKMGKKATAQMLDEARAAVRSLGHILEESDSE